MLHYIVSLYVPHPQNFSITVSLYQDKKSFQICKSDNWRGMNLTTLIDSFFDVAYVWQYKLMQLYKKVSYFFLFFLFLFHISQLSPAASRAHNAMFQNSTGNPHRLLRVLKSLYTLHILFTGHMRAVWQVRTCTRRRLSAFSYFGTAISLIHLIMNKKLP